MPNLPMAPSVSFDDTPQNQPNAPKAPSVSFDDTPIQPQQAERRAMNPTFRTIDTAIRGAGNAIPFMSDIAALGDTAVSYLPSGVKGYIPGINQQDQSNESFSQRYSENLARQRGINTAEETDNPVAYYGPEIIGSLAMPMGAAKTIGSRVAGKLASSLNAPAANVIGRSVGTGLVAGGYGALYGAGEGNTLSERGQNALQGAGIGAVAGAAIPAAGSLIGSAGSKITNLYQALTNPDVLASSTLGKAIATDVGKGASAISPSDLAQAVSSGQPVVLGDIGGETTRGLVRTAANISPEARAKLIGVTNERFQSQGGRFSEFLKNMFGNDLNIQTMKDDILSVARPTNSAAYTKAYAEGANGIWNDELANLVRSPYMASAISDANLKSANASVINKQPIVKSPFEVSADGNVSLAKSPDGSIATPTLEYWDQVQRALNGKIGTALEVGDKEAARDYINLRNPLMNELDTAVPSFADARLGAFKFFKAENAVDAGSKFFQMADSAKIDGMKASFSKMTPEQKQQFAQSFAATLAQKAENVSENRNVVNLFNSPASREKMALALGPEQSTQIEAYLRRENAMNLLRNAVSGNSTTARQILGILGERASGPMAGAVAGGSTAYYQNGLDLSKIAQGAAAGAFTGAMVKYSSKANQNVMTKIGQMLASDDPKIKDAAIRATASNPDAMNALRKLENTLSISASKQTNDNLSNPPQNTLQPAITRATGGRVGHEHLVTRLMRAAERAKKTANSVTEPLLQAPDEHIVKALHIANEAIQ